MKLLFIWSWVQIIITLQFQNKYIDQIIYPK